MRHSASQFRDWLAGTHWKRTLPFALLALVLVLAACGGVNDNGTQERALETAAARETASAQPPPPAPTPGPDETPAAGETPVAGGDDPALVEQGRQLHTSKTCIGCHSIDGAQGVGPTWQGLFGSEVTLVDGTSVVADEAYLRESMLQPGAKVHEGFTNIMPTLPLSDDEVAALIAFIKSLQ